MNMLVIGGSAGSLAVVLRILSYLERGWRASVIIIFHRKDSDDGTLTDLLAHHTTWEVKEIEDKEEIKPGVVYVAPANYHVLLETNKGFALDYSEKINYSRPSIDVTFEAVAQVFGKSATGLLLSGANADGVAGLKLIKQYGGRVLVQDPATAETPFMPATAVKEVAVDFILQPDNEERLIKKLFGSKDCVRDQPAD